MKDIDTAEPGAVTMFGVGGAGGNAVGALLQHPARGMRIVCATADVQALQTVPAANRLQLGQRLTAGLGSGARPEIGRAAAEEALPAIEAALDGSAVCFIAVGLGGGTGTGAAPVIARAARARGILTIGVATTPFAFEGKRRARTAEAGAADLAASTDVMVRVCNQTLFGVSAPNTTLHAVLELSDAILGQSARDVARLLGTRALKRIALTDLRALLADSGHAAIGQGEACAGADRARAAVQSALCNPLLQGAPATAQRLLVTVTGGKDLRLPEAAEAIALVRARIAGDATLVWGAAIDPELTGCLRVGIIAAGLPAIRRPVAACSTPYRLPALQPVAAKPAIPARATVAAPVRPLPETPQLALLFESGAAPTTPIDPRVLAIVPRSAVTPSLANRLYRGVRALQRRLQPRPRAVAPIAVPTPGTFHLLKAFDPPPRPPLHATGPFAAIVRTSVVLA